jgi:hypothetical protein
MGGRLVRTGGVAREDAPAAATFVYANRKESRGEKMEEDARLTWDPLAIVMDGKEKRSEREDGCERVAAGQTSVLFFSIFFLFLSFYTFVIYINIY